MQPSTLVRVAAIAGSLALIAIWWQFNGVIEPVTIKIATAGPDELAPLAPDNDLQRVLYRRSLELTILAIGLTLYRAVRRARATGARLDIASTAWAGGVVVIAVLMTVIPYRITFQNDQFVRAQLDGMRCYVLGQDGQELLLYCPDSAAPHHRLVAANDSRLRVEGIFESIFTPAAHAAPPEQP
jgi:hypothetical protein